MNTQVLEELRNAAKIQPGSRETFPSNLSGSIVPTIELNPKIVANADVRRGIATDTTSTTILTTQTGVDTYITSVALSVLKDAGATSTRSEVLATNSEGKSIQLLTIAGAAATAQSETISITFPHPIKLARGTTVTVANSAGATYVSAAATISYFIDNQADA